ncbi:hypothetical protein HYPDE_38303 [Hyphomicrobium denitrificans 1NES1]|uniref:Uncharacterized protein n=1 Tax=Hyphomicrobium denitrificans 1NES1 TaxID=670307 RepID=N0BAQ0_9HYPH|nr:hypothetical protein [Hyphomicrobium denitrificans]AGK59332.1 hypothetical protein HYPDE_38303 [Hyphomicrobium denitrificans 1NES1]
MFEDNVIWVDFRLSKDIRSKQELSFAERMKAHSERTCSHVQASKTALEMIKKMLGEEQWGGDGPHLSGKS